MIGVVHFFTTLSQFVEFYQATGFFLRLFNILIVTSYFQKKKNFFWKGKTKTVNSKTFQKNFFYNF